ncbi:MAG: ABC transporter substrate-binding protein [Cyanobacteria bacterium J06633_23]
MFQVKRLCRRQFNLMLGFMSMMLLIGFSACGHPPVIDGNSTTNPSSERDAIPTEFRIGYQLTGGPETLAKGLKLMEKQFPDVSIRWLPFDSGPAVNEAFAAGNIDAGLVGSVPAATGIAQELPYQVYFLFNIIGDNQALVATEESDIKSIADLPGKTIGVPFGSTSHFSFLSALEQENINPDDLQVLNLQPQDLLSAWQLGEIDGGFVWQPTLARMLDKESSNVVVTARKLAEKGIITADLGVVNKEFAAQYPDFINSYAEAINTAVKLYQEDPIAASEAMAPEVALSPEETLTLMNELVWLNAEEQGSGKYMGTVDTPGALSQVLKDSADFLVDQGVLLSAPDVEAYQGALYHQAIANVRN